MLEEFLLNMIACRKTYMYVFLLWRTNLRKFYFEAANFRYLTPSGRFHTNNMILTVLSTPDRQMLEGTTFKTTLLIMRG